MGADRSAGRRLGPGVRRLAAAAHVRGPPPPSITGRSRADWPSAEFTVRTSTARSAAASLTIRRATVSPNVAATASIDFLRPIRFANQPPRSTGRVHPLDLPGRSLQLHRLKHSRQRSRPSRRKWSQPPLLDRFSFVVDDHFRRKCDSGDEQIGDGSWMSRMRLSGKASRSSPYGEFRFPSPVRAGCH
jgi:hypothetical protein